MAAGLCPDPLGELAPLLRSVSWYKGVRPMGREWRKMEREKGKKGGNEKSRKSSEEKGGGGNR